jgi:hypothetical protein
MGLRSPFLHLVYFEGLSLLQVKSLSLEEHLLFEMISVSPFLLQILVPFVLLPVSNYRHFR